MPMSVESAVCIVCAKSLPRRAVMAVPFVMLATHTANSAATSGTACTADEIGTPPRTCLAKWREPWGYHRSAGAHGIAMIHDGAFVFVSNIVDGSVAVLDVATQSRRTVHRLPPLGLSTRLAAIRIRQEHRHEPHEPACLHRAARHRHRRHPHGGSGATAGPAANHTGAGGGQEH